jgi:hypothetical protein
LTHSHSQITHVITIQQWKVHHKIFLDVCLWKHSIY